MEYYLKENKLHLLIESMSVKSVSEFMEQYVPSKKIRHLLIQNKWLYIDDLPAKRESLLSGKELIIDLYPQATLQHLTNKLPEVVYEDEFIIVVNKKAGQLVHSDGNSVITLKDEVDNYFYNKNEAVNLQPLHRLDKETAGLVAFCKTAIFQPLFDQMLSNKQIDRRYIAVVKGNVAKGQRFTFNESMGKDRHNANKQVITRNGDKAVTKVISLGTDGNYSVLNCRLETGRTHQIRLHLSYHHLPILNDNLYGVQSALVNDMALMALNLRMYHPFKEEQLNITCEPSYQIKYLLSKVEE